MSTLNLWVIAAAALSVALGMAGEGTAASGGGTERDSKGVVHVDAAGAAKLIAAKKVKVLDIRTPEEYAEGHIAGATLVNFNAPDFRKKIEGFDRKQSYLVHCRSGGRSTKSLTMFKELGFESITHLDGGIMGWTKAGQPVEK